MSEPPPDHLAVGRPATGDQSSGEPPEDSGPRVPDLTSMPDGAHYSARVPMALTYAAVMHSDQSRKDDAGTPYIVHPMAVATLVWHYGLRVAGFAEQIEDLVLGALLHDVAEDAGGRERLAEIESMFGPRVAQIVDAASDSLEADPDAKGQWRQRKQAHIERVCRLSAVTAEGVMADPGACLVIACDKLHNLTGTAAGVQARGEDYFQRFQGGPEGTRWYYRAMFEALRPGLPDAIITQYASQLALLGGGADG